APAGCLGPGRCFTGGGVISGRYAGFQEAIRRGDDPAAALDALGMGRYCCRRMLLTTVETIRQIIPFREAVHRRNLEIKSELE
ncbi:MAG: DNA-directed RNA polymerase subunit N, partial [Thaumarchaeota archaeon]|nr:DNA-directed RNA polymerase subunit N [Nitrososphaerota archaeon]